MSIGKLELNFELVGEWRTLLRGDCALNNYLSGREELARSRRSAETTLPGAGGEFAVNFQGCIGRSGLTPEETSRKSAKEAYITRSLTEDNKRKFKFGGLEFGSNEKSFGAILDVPACEGETRRRLRGNCDMHPASQGQHWGPAFHS